MQCSETGNGIALQHPIFLGLFGAFLPVVIKSSAHCVTNIFKVTPLFSTPRVCQWFNSFHSAKPILYQKAKVERKTWYSGMKGWVGLWEESGRTSRLFVSEAPSSASQRTSSCCGQLDQCLNCLHWIFHSYQKPSLHQWWKFQGFDIWNYKRWKDGKKTKHLKPCFAKKLRYFKYYRNAADTGEKKRDRSDGNLLAAHKLLTYGGEVHWFLDDLPVSRDRFQVDRGEKRPCILMAFQLSEQNPVE